MTPELLPPAHPPKEEDRRPLSSVFDTLVDSNIQLTKAVGKLVWLTCGVLVFNVVLVAIVIFVLGRHA